MEEPRMTTSSQAGKEKGDGPGKPGDHVTILVNNRPVKLDDDHATGSQIKAAAGLPADFKLYDEKGREIDNDKRVKLKDGERYTAISGQDVS
jgi:hypothetical protein